MAEENVFSAIFSGLSQDLKTFSFKSITDYINSFPTRFKMATNDEKIAYLAFLLGIVLFIVQIVFWIL